jgi:hypothetical protein
MRRLNRLIAAFILVCAAALSTYAGDIPNVHNSPAPLSAVNTGEIPNEVTSTGQIDCGLTLIGEIDCGVTAIIGLALRRHAGSALRGL